MDLKTQFIIYIYNYDVLTNNKKNTSLKLRRIKFVTDAGLDWFHL